MKINSIDIDQKYRGTLDIKIQKEYGGDYETIATFTDIAEIYGDYPSYAEATEAMKQDAIDEAKSQGYDCNDATVYCLPSENYIYIAEQA